MLRALVLLAVALSATAAFAGEYNAKLSIGDAAPAWENLPGTDDKDHSLAELADKKAVVVVFTCNSCPYAVDYEDRIIRFAKAHAGPASEVALVAINVNQVPEDRLPKMKERAEKKGFPYPYLYDETQKIAREFGAIYTPEFYVLDRDRRVVYMGAMDDSSMEAKVTKSYLKPAVDAALQGELPDTKETGAVGCRIRFERERRRK